MYKAGNFGRWLERYYGSFYWNSSRVLHCNAVMVSSVLPVFKLFAFRLKKAEFRGEP